MMLKVVSVLSVFEMIPVDLIKFNLMMVELINIVTRKIKQATCEKVGIIDTMLRHKNGQRYSSRSVYYG